MVHTVGNEVRATRYAEMAAQLTDKSFSAEQIIDGRSNFHFPANGKPEPLTYAAAPLNLAFPAVRILAATIGVGESDEASRQLAQLACRASEAISKLLPPDTATYQPVPGTLHCTVFHPSSPSQPVELDAAGLAAEREAVRQCVASTSGPLELRA